MADHENSFALTLFQENAEIVQEALHAQDGNAPWIWGFQILLDSFPNPEVLDAPALLLSSQVNEIVCENRPQTMPVAPDESSEERKSECGERGAPLGVNPIFASQPSVLGRSPAFQVDRCPNLGHPLRRSTLAPQSLSERKEEDGEGRPDEGETELAGLDWRVLMAKKHAYRQDEIYKLVIRHLVKLAREAFSGFVEERGARKLNSPPVKENLLRAFLRLHYGLEVRPEELDLAKSLLYSFSLKLQECGEESKRLRRVREMRSLFLERGTQKEAEGFFQQELTVRCFFADFSRAMEIAGREKHIREKWKIVRGFRKLVFRLHRSEAFRQHLEALERRGFQLPPVFLPRQ